MPRRIRYQSDSRGHFRLPKTHWLASTINFFISSRTFPRATRMESCGSCEPPGPTVWFMTLPEVRQVASQPRHPSTLRNCLQMCYSRKLAVLYKQFVPLSRKYNRLHLLSFDIWYSLSLLSRPTHISIAPGWHHLFLLSPSFVQLSTKWNLNKGFCKKHV